MMRFAFAHAITSAAKSLVARPAGRLALGVALCALSSQAFAADPTGDDAVRTLIRPRTQAVLSSEIAGRILRLPLHEGDRFRSGEVLVEFDCSWVTAAQSAAQAGLTHAQARLSGLEALASMRSAGSMDVALARAEVERARAELKTASLSVKHCVVNAPFNGRVIDLRARAFESVPANTPLLSVLDDSDLEASLVVPSSWLTWLKPGNAFTLEIDETHRRYSGRITRLGASVDPVSQTVTVFGSLNDVDPSVVAGMSGTARIPQSGTAEAPASGTAPGSPRAPGGPTPR
ncbi:efflux RND transporter periplasmic adaptor subunit [Azospirillum picis]|uniref:RND family efflux transporter MFP subunit n=1 Tax=Azospirillum picis TaxID=488438 RepID=A0ABU0MRY2_9PROT|nr:efflux RND transporter periplasmic adaptor subunit [Azospirillum picis]MBP2300817.1 RND family efflux transporter MFP subunit [Azospirillum picis]MDQ0536074.1 RND family efflux transporter MFP subunit [Azospirillum picis]